MAITHTIDPTAPDGATQTVSILDNEDRQHKIDVKERMEDSLIDTGIAGWYNTTQKELIEGLARVFTDTRANQAGLTRLFDGKVFIATDPNNTDAFEYYNGAAWTPVPICTTNLLADAVTTAKIPDNAITTPKILATAVTGFQTRTVDTVDRLVTSGVYAALPGGIHTFTITPTSTSSVLMFMFTCVIGAAGSPITISLRIRDLDGAGTTIAEFVTNATLTGIPICLAGMFQPASTALRTVRVEGMRATNNFNIFNATNCNSFFSYVELKR